MLNPLLEIKGLRTHFNTYAGVVKALDGVNISVHEGKTLGVVGETGCGKSVTALSVLRLIPNPPGDIVAGEVLLRGEDLLKNSEKDMRHIRGNRISMVFQDPYASLNPLYTVGEQVIRVIRLHQQLSKEQAQEKTLSMFERVGLPNPDRILKSYPFELSGGMQQRVMIALALSSSPDLLIADEPTTALDVTIQAQILRLMRELKNELNTSIMLITHDLGVIASMCDRVAVMYAGTVVEHASILQLFQDPKHPYTQGLLDAIPVVGKAKKRLAVIPGTVPNLIHPPSGCRFHPRCTHAMPKCREAKPAEMEVDEGRFVTCFLYGDETTPEYMEGK